MNLFEDFKVIELYKSNKSLDQKYNDLKLYQESSYQVLYV